MHTCTVTFVSMVCQTLAAITALQRQLPREVAPCQRIVLEKAAEGLPHIGTTRQQTRAHRRK